MIQWSAQSKMMQTSSRPRSRRRVGEATDHAAAAPAPMPNTPILVDDEEDDVVVSSPRSFAQAIFKSRVEAHRSTRPARVPAVEDPFVEAHRSTRPARGPAVEDPFEARVEAHRSTRPARGPVVEDPLELRLGPGGTAEFSFQAIVTGRRGRPARSTIDLTTAFRSAPVNEDCVLLHEYTKNTRKRKPVPADPFFVKEVAPEPTPTPPPAPEAEEYRFKCAVCMDTMKEETSTICGHIFCRACIQGAIQAQKKCPTCRKKLTMKNIHRIYL